MDTVTELWARGTISPRQIGMRVDGYLAFKVAQRYWMTEQKLAWLAHWRRFVQDCDQRITVVNSRDDVALGRILLTRIAH